MTNGVEIVPDPRIPEGHKAVPSKVHVSPGGTIVWVNNTVDRVVIEISDERIFRDRMTQEIAKGNRWSSPPVSAEAPNGEYDYGIYCYSNRKYAGGSPSPQIIIP